VTTASQPLMGVRVLDFSTLLPGPLCTLLLAEAGAEVIKVEKPDGGDVMRSYLPRFGDTSVNFALLNRGKRSLALDLRRPEDLRRVLDEVRRSDILIEQFRPGVMERLGLGYEQLRGLKPDLIYCSITGYGAQGPLAKQAAHDLNFVAEAGLLSQTTGEGGAPQLPQALIADIAGGTYPAMINILLALRRRDAGGGGSRLDIAMADSLFTMMYWGLGNGFATGRWPQPSRDLVTGGSPRYQIYRTRDDRFMAAAPLEDKFWQQFLDVLGAPHLIDDTRDPQGVCAAVAEIVRSRDAADWMQRFEGVDACVNFVLTLEQAVRHPHFVERGLFAYRVTDQTGQSMPAVPVPIASAFRADPQQPRSYPALGEAQTQRGSVRGGDSG
jgi:alpha-methylacyl-CoA racemase